MSRTVMQQALDALEKNTTDRDQRCTYCGQHHCSIDCDVSAAIEALRTELAKLEPVPVATVHRINGLTVGYLEIMLPVGTKLYTREQL